MGNFNDFTAYGYEVIEQLGANHGAGRITYLARNMDSGKSVVIKQFQFARSDSSWDGHKAIVREVEILKQLQHPNIPRYLSSFETNNGSCIVQEYIDGRTLSAIISSRQLYTPDQVKDIILKLLEVLVYLQNKFIDPVIHRDIKPANILINSLYQPYLIDFGAAKVSEGEGGSTFAIGTLGFMPPEQRLLKFNKTTDIYSLGLTIICWLTRTEPSKMDNIINLANNQVIKLREQLFSYHLRFVAWLEKVVHPDPTERYPDAEAALAAFKPLYLKRFPEAIISSSILNFTSSKLGEQITGRLTVQNSVPETILERHWEVVPHPNDALICENEVPYKKIFSLIPMISVMTLLIFVYIPELIPALLKIFIFSSLISTTFLEISVISVKTVIIKYGFLIFIGVMGLFDYYRSYEFIGLLENDFNKIQGLFFTLVLFCICSWMILNVVKNLKPTYESCLLRIAILLAICSGIIAPFIIVTGFHIISLIFISLTMVPLNIILVNIHIRNKRILNESSDLKEEGLIKP